METRYHLTASCNVHRAEKRASAVGIRPSALSPARALLAVRRAARAAQRRRDRDARSRSCMRSSSARLSGRSRSRWSSPCSTPRITRVPSRLAKASAEYRETGTGSSFRHRARFWPTDATKLRDLFELVGRFDACEVLIDDRPVPYARELWLPLIWFLIPR